MMLEYHPPTVLLMWNNHYIWFVLFLNEAHLAFLGHSETRQVKPFQQRASILFLFLSSWVGWATLGMHATTGMLQSNSCNMYVKRVCVAFVLFVFTAQTPTHISHSALHVTTIWKPFWTLPWLLAKESEALKSRFTEIMWETVHHTMGQNLLG